MTGPEPHTADAAGGRRLLALATALAVLAIASAVWHVVSTRRRLETRAEESLGLLAEARARALERRLAAIRAELTFLAHSPAVEALPLVTELESSEERWQRIAAEGAFLLFLRAHPEVRELSVFAPEPLARATRRGGVPVVWQSSVWADDPPEPVRPPPPQLAVTVGATTLEAALDLPQLLTTPGLPQHCSCYLSPPGAPAPLASPTEIARVSDVVADGLQPGGVWALGCRRDRVEALAELPAASPIEAMGLLLSLGVVTVALALGVFALQERRRSDAVEARIREQDRSRELEHQLLHSDRLATVGRVAAGLAHDLNNPLEGMTNYLSMARRDAQRGDRASLEKHLRGIEQGIDLASGVVKQVLARSDADAGPSRLIDLAELARASVAFVETRRDPAPVTFHADLPEPLPVRGRPTLLSQLLLNLLLNACESQPRGGEVRIEGRARPATIRISVSDRGSGVPSEEVARIFEPFFSTKGSTGLGLHICRAIVDQHGGSLTFAPREGGGAIFSLELPRATDPTPPLENPPATRVS